MTRPVAEGRRRQGSVRNLPPDHAGGHIGELAPGPRRAARALRAFGHDLPSLSSPRQILDECCRVLVRHAGYRMAWIGLARDDAGHSVTPVASAGVAEGYLETAHITWADDERGRGPTGTAIRACVPFVVQNVLTDPRFEPWRVEAMHRGYAASASIPLVPTHGRCLGAINVYAEEPNAFDRAELELLRRLAAELVMALQAAGLHD
jgi:GAF domain-containing protein